MALNRALVKIKPVVNGTPAESWTDLPAPYGYKMTSTTLVNSARNSKGFVIASVVREGIRKIEMTWNFLTVTQFSNLAKLFEGTATGGTGSFSFYVDYFDTVVGQYVNSQTDYLTPNNNQPREFYVGDRVTDTAKIKLDDNSQPIGYTNVKLSLIEK